MRKRRQWDLSFGMVTLGGFFFLGGVLGVLLASFATEEVRSSVQEYFMFYFTLAEQGEAVPDLWKTIFVNIKIPTLVFLLGFSFLGIVILPFLFLVEGFIFTFSVSIFCRFLGFSELFSAFILFCLPAFFWVPVLFLLGVQSFHSAMLLWKKGKREEAFSKSYFARAFLGMIGIFLVIMVEYFVTPFLIQMLLVI